MKRPQNNILFLVPYVCTIKMPFRTLTNLYCPSHSVYFVLRVKFGNVFWDTLRQETVQVSDYDDKLRIHITIMQPQKLDVKFLKLNFRTVFQKNGQMWMKTFRHHFFYMYSQLLIHIIFWYHCNNVHVILYIYVWPLKFKF